MDLTLIKEHPWTTAGIVLGGGVLLFVVMRRGGSSAPAGTQYVSAGSDPGAAQSAAYQTQMQTYLSGLQLQGATQVSLAQIGADVSRLNTAATADTINTRTAAELELGLGTLNAQTEQTRISASIQLRYIDAIIAAFTGSGYQNNPATQNPPIATTTPNSPNPTAINTPPTYVSYPASTSIGLPDARFNPNPFTLVPGADPLPGGTQVAPYPVYANCDPRDVACVMNNQATGVSYRETVDQNQVINNRNRCLANAELSRGYGNYSSLVAACG